MTDDQIRYDVLIQDALRSVIFKVLTEVSKNGLPGDHYFFITFSTLVKGVRISSQLRANYPEKMTIILQNQFWDLKVNEHSFEVGVSFNMVPEKLTIPFYSILTFVDPSVSFKVDFDIKKINEPQEAEDLLFVPCEANSQKPEHPNTPQEDLMKRLEVPFNVLVNKDTDANKVVSLNAFRKNKSSPPPQKN